MPERSRRGSASTGMQIQQLCPTDALRYKSLMLHAYAESADAFTSTPEERAAEPDSWWASRIAHPTGLSQVFGAFSGDDLVGAVTMAYSEKHKTRHKADLLGMFVAPASRGRGVGRALLTKALAAARERGGVTVVTLTATQGNEAALALYVSAGFAAYGVEPMAVGTPHGYLAKVHLWLPLPL